MLMLTILKRTNSADKAYFFLHKSMAIFNGVVLINCILKQIVEAEMQPL